MCDCVCTSCVGSSHCGSCTGERGKELRGGIYTRCDCKLRNGIQDDCLRISCKRSPSSYSDRSERNVQRTMKQEQTQDMGDFNEQRISGGMDTGNQLRSSHNNGLGDGLQNYSNMPTSGGQNNPAPNSNAYQQGQALFNAMFSQNAQMNSYPHPPNAISNYFTPTNQPTPYNFPLSPYNQSNQLDLNTMLNQTQFKEPSDSINMYYQGKAQHMNQLSDQIKNQNKDNYGQGDSSNSNGNNNSNSKAASINCLPINNGTFGSMVISPPNVSGAIPPPPISFPLMDPGAQNGFAQWNGNGDMQGGNNNPQDTPFYPCMAVILNLQNKSNYFNKKDNFNKNNRKKNLVTKVKSKN